MAQTPQTRLQLFKLKNCDSTYNYVSNFLDMSVDNYFNTNIDSSSRYEFTDMQYIRKNGSVDVPLIYDIAEDYNYCRYDNGEGRGWEYAFITSKEFVNFNMTRISLQFDVWNNYLDSMKSYNKAMIVDRLSQNPSTFSNILSDVPVEATLNDDITYDFCPYIENEIMVHLVFRESIQSEEQLDYPSPYSSLKTLEVPYPSRSSDSFIPFLELLTSAKIANAYIYCIPTVFMSRMQEKFMVIDGFRLRGFIYREALTPSYYIIRDVDLYHNDTPLATLYNNVDDKKIISYPYTKLIIHTASSNLELNPALFNSKIDIRVSLVLDGDSPSILYKLYDKYDNVHMIEDSGVKLPIVISEYSNYLAYNSSESQKFMTNIMFDMLKSTLTSASKISSGDKIGALTNTISNGLDIAQQVKNRDYMIKDLKNAPINIVEKGTIGKIIQLFNCGGLHMQLKVCDEDTQQRLMDYWNEFGYKYAEKMEFNKAIYTRRFYNFLQVQNAYFPFIMCDEEKRELIRILSNGVHIYHYNQDAEKNYGTLVSNSVNRYVGG